MLGTWGVCLHDGEQPAPLCSCTPCLQRFPPSLVQPKAAALFPYTKRHLCYFSPSCFQSLFHVFISVSGQHSPM